MQKEGKITITKVMSHQFKYEALAKEMDCQIIEDKYEIYEKIIDEYIGKLDKIKRLEEPEIIFTGGCYGSGKSHTIKYMFKEDIISKDNYLYIDPDVIRFKLPEIGDWIKNDPWSAGEKTQLDCGFISLIIQMKVLEMGYSLIVDGSLQDDKWYGETYIPWIRNKYPLYKIKIFFVRASWQKTLERCWQRCEQTKRCIPLSLLRSIHNKMPLSIKKLSNIVDSVLHIDNEVEPEFTTDFSLIKN